MSLWPIPGESNPSTLDPPGSHATLNRPQPIMGVLKQEQVEGSWEGRTTSPSIAGPQGSHPVQGSHHMEQKYRDSLCSIPENLPPPLHPYMDHPAHRPPLIPIGITTKPEVAIESGESDIEPPLCAGCRIRITDKFYLCAVERKWHSSCLKCVECGSDLENEASCFEREGQIFCREDYLRLYGGSPCCSRCHVDIKSTDLVMKARHCIFHIECFRCATCDSSLRKGDLFGMFEDILYCRLHFEMIASYGGGQGEMMELGPGMHSPNGDMYPPGMGGPHPGAMFGAGPPPGFPGPPEHWPYGPGPEFGGIPDYQFNNNNEPIKKRRGRKKRKVDDFAAMNGYMEGYPPGMDGHGVNSAKTKRARTSFKHHQLRIMKAHFQINQNPDSRELKMLSQKTGLDKKVLQVWFQNARAKWRRMNAQGGGGVDALSALGGPDDDIKGEDMSPGDCGSGSDHMISCC